MKTQGQNFLNDLCNPRTWHREADTELNKGVLHERKVAQTSYMTLRVKIFIYIFISPEYNLMPEKVESHVFCMNFKKKIQKTTI